MASWPRPLTLAFSPQLQPGLAPGAAKPEPKLSKNQKKNVRKKQQKESGADAEEEELANALAGTNISSGSKQPDWVPGTAPAAKSDEPAGTFARDCLPRSDLRCWICLCSTFDA